MSLTLITVIGGRISTLEQMLDHYIALGIDSVLLYAHLKCKGDPIRDQIDAIAKVRGITITGEGTGDWMTLQRRAFGQIATAPRVEWFLVADQDEFQQYRGDVKEIVTDCEKYEFDFVRGCLIDRFTRDGRLPYIDPNRSLPEQFPIGCFLTRPVLRGNPMKIVAARGGVQFTNGGHHYASKGNGCPIQQRFIQVDHYKWTMGLVDYLTSRSRSLSEVDAVKAEDLRLEKYLAQFGGSVDLKDPILMAAPCSPEYPYWISVRAICEKLDFCYGPQPKH